MSDFKRDLFSVDEKFTIDEKASEVDGEHILAKISGPFFVPGGYSRNKRYYSESLWDKQLAKPDVQEKISERRMFGTISHEQELGDKALLEGKLSHIVTKLESKTGKGEALVLSTPAGRILNTVMRAGSKLFTSSRADGQYKGQKNGADVVDEDSYRLDTFDFVLDPGFKQACPGITEEMKKDFDYVFSEGKKEQNDIINNEKKEEQMSGENAVLLENLIGEKKKLELTIESALKESDELKKVVTARSDEITTLTEKVVNFDKVCEELKAYQELGTKEEVAEKLTAMDTLVEDMKTRDIGTPEEIDGVLTEAIEKITEYNELGTPEEIAEVFEKTKEKLDAYKDLGTPEEISEALDKGQLAVDKIKGSVLAERAIELAEELKVDLELVKPLIGKMTEEEIKKYFENFKASAKIKSKYEKGGTNPFDKKKKKKDGEDDEDADEKKFSNKTSGKRLMESFSR
tara:strand:+ start:374 stop:1753 length:1380 start_codon:yes stop_codon:yes gene_type:complete